MFTFTVGAITSERCAINGALKLPTMANLKWFIYLFHLTKLFKSQGLWALNPKIMLHDVTVPVVMARSHSLKMDGNNIFDVYCLLNVDSIVVVLNVTKDICHGCGQLYGTSECFPRNSGGVRNSEFAHGVRTTLSSCQQNTNLFGRAGLTTPTRLGFLFRRTFYVTFRCNGIHDYY